MLSSFKFPDSWLKLEDQNKKPNTISPFVSNSMSFHVQTCNLFCKLITTIIDMVPYNH